VVGTADLRVGEKVRVKLMATNVEHGFIDFVRTD
jgi:exoribonuclease-2